MWRLLVNKSPHFQGKSPHFQGKSPHFQGKSPHFQGKSPHFPLPALVYQWFALTEKEFKKYLKRI